MVTEVHRYHTLVIGEKLLIALSGRAEYYFVRIYSLRYKESLFVQKRLNIRTKVLTFEYLSIYNSM